MLEAVLRYSLLVGAPAEFGRLHAFGQEAFHRPGVDEDLDRLRLFGALGVALGDMDAFDAGLLGERAPFLAGLRLLELQPEVGGDVQKRLLDEPRHHAGIGAAAGNRRGAAGSLAARRQHGLAQRIVRARFRPELCIEVEPGPGLDHGVDVKGADLAAEFHDVDRRRVDRQIDAKALPAALGEQRTEELAVIVARYRLMDEAYAAIVQEFAVFVLGVDDHEAGFVIIEMTLDQRQRAFADRAEADHDNRPGDTGVDGPCGHNAKSPAAMYWVISAATRKRKRRRGF